MAKVSEMLVRREASEASIDLAHRMRMLMGQDLDEFEISRQVEIENQRLNADCPKLFQQAWAVLNSGERSAWKQWIHGELYMAENNEMELIGTALQTFDKVAAGLSILEKQYKGVLFDTQTTLGMTHAKAARAAIREPRYDIERVRKEAKAPILALGKRLDAEATRITSALLTLETPIDEQIKEEESRKERERLAAAATEAKRVAGIQGQIETIRRIPSTAQNKSSEAVQKILDDASFLEVTEAGFQEFTANAQQAYETTLAALRGILAERTAHEAEQQRVAAERAELARLRAEQEKRDAAERARLAEEERVAREARDAENARQEAINKAERARIAEEERAAKAVRDAETARLAEESRKQAEAHQAELDRIAEVDRKATEARDAADDQLRAERAQLERDQEALRVSQLPKAASSKESRDLSKQIVAEGISVQRKADGHWILIDHAGKHAAFNIEATFQGKIVRETIVAWIDAQLEQ